MVIKQQAGNAEFNTLLLALCALYQPQYFLRRATFYYQVTSNPLADITTAHYHCVQTSLSLDDLTPLLALGIARQWNNSNQ